MGGVILYRWAGTGESQAIAPRDARDYRAAPFAIPLASASRYARP